jgi:hypothetical protein
MARSLEQFHGFFTGAAAGDQHANGKG